MPACVEITIRAVEGGRPVTTADLESLPGLDRKALDAFKSRAIRIFDDDDWRSGRNLSRATQISGPPERIRDDEPRIRPDAAAFQREALAALRERPDDELAAVAQVYRDNLRGNPVQAVADAFDLSQRTASRRIKAARDRGFLPQTTRGRKKA